ncbi:hypothetical protein F5I97DRAFT_1808953 [Phlebopus sp. FC_14]|nr:hypothetical protein F5I97DRAFT_1808953 [Phlebopus sp. FC_14]
MPGVDRPTQLYRYASQLPETVWNALSRKEASANIILPFAEKARDHHQDDRQLWIVYYNEDRDVVFVLSCTEGPLGKYPIFIFTPMSQEELAQPNVTDPVELLALTLLDSIPDARQRVFSVFSCVPVARKFAESWNNLTKAQIEEAPYYDATLTYCTGDTITDASIARPLPQDLSISLRRADESHVEKVGHLCRSFSQLSEPYVLDEEGARREAQLLVSNQEVWIHLIQRGSSEWDVASLVATTRQSKNVSAVTKVYTNPEWRNFGCAERLLRRVCKELLAHKEQIVLFVGTELCNARDVYRRVGFQGLDPGQQDPIDGVEQWLEIGFKGTALGHW